MNEMNQEMESINHKQCRMAKLNGPRSSHFVSTSTPASKQADSGYFDSQELLHQNTFGSMKNASGHSFGDSGGIPDNISLFNVSQSASLECVGQQQPLASVSVNSKFLTPSSTQCSDSLLHDFSTPSTDAMFCTSGDSKNSVPCCDISISGDYHLKEKCSFLTGGLFVSSKSHVNSSLHFPDVQGFSDTRTSEGHFDEERSSPSVFSAKGTPDSRTSYGLRKREWNNSSSLFQSNDCLLPYNSSSCAKEKTQEKVKFSVLPSTSKSPKVSSILNKSRSGKTVNKYIDFIKELLKKNCKNVLKTLFSFFAPKDLCRISWVSQQWRTAVTSDRLANRRRQAYMKCRRKIFTGPNKENSKCHKRGPSGVNREVLVDTQNILHQTRRISQNATKTTSTPKSRFEYFIEEAKGLKENERIQMCPSCVSPCRVSIRENRGKCCTPSCSYEFCTKCFHRYHQSPRCPVLISGTTPKIPIISSRKSRMNLRRL